MKKLKIAFLLFLNIFILSCLYPDDIINYNVYEEGYFKRDPPLLFGKIAYSFLGDYNISMGLDLVIFKPRLYPYDWEWLGWPEHIIGIDYQYQFTEKDSILRLDYTYIFAIFFTIGLSNRYNINKQEFGIAPKIGFQFFFQFFRLNLDYRYNIIINKKDKNFHEITLSISIPLFFSESFFER